MDMTSAAEARSWYDNQRLGGSPGTSAALGHQTAAVDPSEMNPFYPLENSSHRRYYPTSYGPHGKSLYQTIVGVLKKTRNHDSLTGFSHTADSYSSPRVSWLQTPTSKTFDSNPSNQKRFVRCLTLRGGATAVYVQWLMHVKVVDYPSDGVRGETN
ncbi:AGAP004228-PA-like protein [Anopheles sinensis]|uniref:AGAP004228-PA-like protein n=1 Tax=Anopheles sinensis TaxID=74873 RepID=A0A084W1C4_ANOSI|nr:AGAP004228-PA-like protein [Anopheles sinensis]